MRDHPGGPARERPGASGSRRGAPQHLASRLCVQSIGEAVAYAVYMAPRCATILRIFVNFKALKLKKSTVIFLRVSIVTIVTVLQAGRIEISALKSPWVRAKLVGRY